MSTKPHLWVALSSHGFGHLAQVAPVLNELRRRLPTLRLTVQCALPEGVVRSRIQGAFDYQSYATDIGLVMASATQVEAETSLAAYRDFHASWEERLDRESERLQRKAPDLVFADIPYLPLVAAARCKIPTLALCSLNWADIFEHYFPHEPELETIQNTMLAAYGSAETFLRPAPSMPMPGLTNTRAIGPIAAIGRDRRSEIEARLHLENDTTLVLVALGGYDLPLPLERWPRMPKVDWLVPAEWKTRANGIHQREAVADIPFVDLVHSCDVLLIKPGYGAFAEAVCAARPVLYIERHDWPETPWLVNWLEQYGNGLQLTNHQLEAGELAEPLTQLLAQPRRPALTPTGIQEAADYLQRRLC